MASLVTTVLLVMFLAQVTQAQDVVAGTCPIFPPPAECPPEPDDECKTDGDCAKLYPGLGQKCCKDGCDFRCVTPDAPPTPPPQRTVDYLTINCRAAVTLKRGPGVWPFRATSCHDPIWTPREMDKFWSVIEPYLIQLLNGTAPFLPHHDMDFTKMDPQSKRDFRQCLEQIHEELWQGKYSQTVANLKAAREFFRSILAKECSGSTPSCRDELHQLKEIFFEQPGVRGYIQTINW